MRFYQALPFPEYADLKSSRSKEDCEGRWQAMKTNMGDITGKTLIDLCCANAYFGFRFLQDGGKSVICYDNDREVVDFVNDLARTKKMNLVCKDIVDKTDRADFGIYLDTHFHDGTETYLGFMKSAVKVLYTSSSRSYTEYREVLKLLFDNVVEIYDENYAQRRIYRCE